MATKSLQGVSPLLKTGGQQGVAFWEKPDLGTPTMSMVGWAQPQLPQRLRPQGDSKEEKEPLLQGNPRATWLSLSQDP